MIKEIIISLILGLSLVFPGAARAQVNYYLPYPGILPDHPLYWVKMIRDRVQLWFIFDKEQKAEKMLLYSDKRLGAAWALIEGQKQDLGVTTLTKGEKYLEEAVRLASDQIFKEKLNKAMMKHQEVLKLLENKTADRNKEVVKQLAEKLQLQIPEAVIVSVKVDFGTETIEEKVAAETALEALTKIAEKQQWEIKMKTYDFGSLVESVAGKQNTKDKAWIYWVNGKSGEVGADKYELKLDDEVEWKYEKPSY